jgi:hypothetical protein
MQHKIDEKLSKYNFSSPVRFTRHIGGGLYVRIMKTRIDLRKFEMIHKEIVPTRHGLCITSDQWQILKRIATIIDMEYSEIADTILCINQQDHFNQLGWLRCRECVPFPEDNDWYFY